MLIKTFSIEWDTDGKDVDLPQVVEIDVKSEESVADALSDRYGFCVSRVGYQAVSPKKPNAGDMRAALSTKVLAAHKKGDEFFCWGEMFEIYRNDIVELAKLAKISTGEVTACLIDDVESRIE